MNQGMLINLLISRGIVWVELVLRNAVAEKKKHARKLNENANGRKHLPLWHRVYSTNKEISVNMMGFETKINYQQQTVLLFGGQV